LNVDWLANLPAPARRALYFGLQRGLGSRIGPVWREFLAWEKFSPAQLNEAVDAKLSRLLAAATTHSEYYRNLDLARRADESARDWLRRFPTLNRVTLRENFTTLVTDSLRGEITSPDSVSHRRYDWLVVKTGGTTGTPTTVVHDANTRDWGRATRLYALRQCGFPLGTRYFRLWGSEQDLLNQQVSLPQRVLRALLAEIPMNAFRAREADLRRHLETLQAHPKVEHLMTYVDAAAGLAMFLNESKLTPPKLKTIMACAGTVTPEFRQILMETFRAEVFDKYGSRECSDLACECSAHNGLHIFSPHAFVEILDEHNQPCPPGVTGRIVVTMLNNLSFPMIRYEIGDLGVWADAAPCACGSPFPRLASLQGRADDMLVTEDGTLQSSVFVRHFVGVSLNRQLIQQWQLEQTGRTQFVFRYIAVSDAGLAENLARLKESFQLVFGKSAQIEMRAVQEILPTATGKIRWIVRTYGRK
jgi:phenylacetate-CoA ligase